MKTTRRAMFADSTAGLYRIFFLVAMHAMARHTAGAFEIIKGSECIRISQISQRTTPTRQRNNIWQDRSPALERTGRLSMPIVLLTPWLEAIWSYKVRLAAVKIV